MALEGRNWRTLQEIVCSMSEEELTYFSRVRAQRESDPSSYESIRLDTEELFKQYLELYRRWRREAALRGLLSKSRKVPGGTADL